MVKMCDLYKDHCVIKRFESVAQNGSEEYTSILSSVCTYQVGSSGDATLRGANIQYGNILIMPYTTAVLRIGDIVTVTTNEGRIINSTILNHDSVNWEGISGTTIWLEGGRDA